MIDTPGFFWTVACFILAIGPLVFVHELGHFLMARLFGVQVDVFSIGFGREVTGWTDRLGTRWKIAWMPLGGYVRFAGDMNGASQEDPRWRQLTPGERDRVFHAKPLWQRALIVLAGPLANFAAALIILAGFAYAYGDSRMPPVVAGIQAGSPAERAGIKVGDKVLEVSGRSVERFEQIYPIVQARPGIEFDMKLEREGQPFTVQITPRTAVERDRFGNEYKLGKIGIAPSGKFVIEEVSLIEAPIVAVRRTGEILDLMVTGIWQVISGRRSVDELGGPIKIAQISGQAASLGWKEFVSFLALISINLGFINLLPVPMLDGGHLCFYAVEAVQRRPVSPRTMEIAFRSGMFVLLALMAFVTLNDLASLGVWRFAGHGG
jgi:regulator of sigma E protease